MYEAVVACSIDPRVVEAGPAAVGPLGRVGDQDVGVELGVAGPRGAVAVGGGEEARAGNELGAACPSSCPAGLALQVVERGLDRLLVGGDHARSGCWVTQRPGQGDRLRCREGEIEAGDRALAADTAHREQR